MRFRIVSTQTGSVKQFSMNMRQCKDALLPQTENNLHAMLRFLELALQHITAQLQELTQRRLP